MKKTITLVLIIIPFFVFSQATNNREIIKNTINKIQVILIKNYVDKQNDSISKLHSKKIKTTTDTQKFILKWYNKKHITYKTWENLNYLHFKKSYTNDTINVNKYLRDKLKVYVKFNSYGSDKTQIYKIIDNATKNIKYTPPKIVVEKKTNEDSVQEKGIVNKIIKPDASKTLNDRIISLEKTIKKLIQEKKNILHLLISFITIVVVFIISFFTINKSLKKMKKKKRKQEKKRKNKKRITIKDNPIINQNNESSIKNIDNTEQKTNTDWLIVHTSEIGKSHLDANPQIPCQDNHSVLQMEYGWGIAISCDGAGSAKLSHKGSKFIADESTKLFEKIILQNNWISKNELPKQSDWEILCNKAMRKLRYDLTKLAEYKKIPVTDLACTIIVVIYSPIGLLSTHIGDGRAGFRDKNGNWEAIITPHKGEEANQTIFITSNPWLIDNFIMSGVKVPESKVINKPPTAFTVMSDGFESHSFEMGNFDKEKQKFIELNRPYTKFFEQIIPTIKKLHSNGKSEIEILESWSNFVKQGTEKIKNEPDDKTIIIGVLKD